jgi:methionyl-tRNA synthetase
MEEFILENMWVIVVLGLWTLPWKGVALWKAARRKELKWFIALLVLNTLAILEIIYIFVFAKKRKENGMNQGENSIS